MNDSDKKYYDNKAIHDAKHRRALSKAANRGEVSVEWHKTNTLTPATLSEFRKAMKQADKQWELDNK